MIIAHAFGLSSDSAQNAYTIEQPGVAAYLAGNHALGMPQTEHETGAGLKSALEGRQTASLP